MKRRYKIPFGAKVERDGVRFRLCAPRAARASLHLEGDPAVERPMEKKTDGTLVLTTAVARPGTRYRYLADGNRYPDPASRRQRMESTDQARLSIPWLMIRRQRPRF